MAQEQSVFEILQMMADHLRTLADGLEAIIDLYGGAKDEESDPPPP